MNKKLIILFITIFILLTAGTVVALTPLGNTIEMFLFGQNLKKYHTEKGAVIATINGTAIYESQIKAEKEALKLTKKGLREQYENEEWPEEVKKQMEIDLNRSDKTDDEILSDIILNEVLWQESCQKGFNISEEESFLEAKKEMETLKNLLNSKNADEQKSAERNYALLKEFMKGYGFSEDEYIKEILTPMTQKNKAYIKLYENFVNNLPETEKENADTLFDKYTDELVNHAKISR